MISCEEVYVGPMRSRYNVLFFTEISGSNFNLEAWAVVG